MEYELKKADLPGVPSKSFVWFNYDTMQQIPTDGEQRRQYDEMIWNLKYKHRDIPYFILGVKDQPFKDVLRQKNHFTSISYCLSKADIKYKANELAMKICKTPSTFQYNKCYANASSDKIYEGFITPGYNQYWAMYPEYFISSCEIKMRVI